MGVAELAEHLQRHLAICGELLQLVERERAALATSAPLDFNESGQQRRKLLPDLAASNTRLQELRAPWQQLNAADRQQFPAVGRLLRHTQEVLMRLIVLDRENQQTMLRRGLVPPPHWPALQPPVIAPNAQESRHVH